MTILKISTPVRKTEGQMNCIRKWRHKGEDERITEDLSNLLKSHGDRILEGGTTLCLTTQVLASLNRQIHQLTEGTSYQTFQVSEDAPSGNKIALIFDFLQKAPQIKITSGPVCSPSPFLCLSYFKQVHYLEVKRVPVCYIKGLSCLRRQIKTLVCSRSTNDIKSVVFQFGKEGTNLYTLPELKELDLSYNTIRCLDESLKILPSLKKLNLSHNCLTNADLEHLPSVTYLNLGFNSISCIPSCPASVANHLTTLILRNNNLSNLEGIQKFTALKCLDVSGNCIVSFDDLIPLARLPRLVNVNLVGNPMGFLADYRENTIARLSPITRKEPVYLDGKLLTPMEELCLGKDVEPVSLRAYIPSEPIGRPTGSLRELAKSLYELSHNGSVERNTSFHTPSPKLQKKRPRKCREAHIIDASNPGSPPASSTPNSTQERALMASIGPIGSRRSSIDESVVWVHKQGESETEVKGGLSSLEYTPFDDSSSVTDEVFDENVDSEQPTDFPATIEGQTIGKSLSTHALNGFITEKTDLLRSPSVSSDKSSSRSSGHGIYSSVPVRLNSLTNLDIESVGSAADHLSDEEDEEFYLVQSVVPNAKDRYGREEKESIFLLVKEPYIIERDPFRDTILHKLDLNYLQDMSFHTLDPLRINLRFSLLRPDRKERVYIFEDPDNMQNFIAILKPIVQRNQDKEFEEMIHFQCLKCSTLFVTSEQNERVTRCPTCGSNLVVEKEEKRDTPTDAGERGRDRMPTPVVQQNHTEKRDNEDQNDLGSVNKSSSIAIVIPFSKNSKTNGGSCPSSFSVEERKVGSSAGSRLSQVAEVTTRSAPKAYTLNMEASYMGNTNHVSGGDSDTLPDDGISGDSDESPLSLLTKDNTTESEASFDIDSNRSARSDMGSRSLSRLSRTSSISGTSSTNKQSNENATQKSILWNKDEFKKLDHRVMLYLVFNVMEGDGEVYCCHLKSPCCSYNKDEEFDCLLVVSSLHIFILKIQDSQSETPEGNFQRVAKYKVSDLKFLDYGYFNQSFRLEFAGEMASYKFLVRDSLRCERFLATLLCVLGNRPESKTYPSVSEEPDIQTIANLRLQLFGEVEDVTSLGHRLFVQATSYRAPSILKTRKVRMRSHENSFVSREFIDWMIARRTVKSKVEGVHVLKRLLNASVIQSVSKDRAVSYNDSIYKFPNSGALKTASDESLSKQESSDDKDYGSDIEEMDYSIVLYRLLLIGVERRDSSLLPRTLVMTKTHLFLADECHQWPLPRLHPPPHRLLDQFSKVDVQQITNATKMEMYESDPLVMKIDFVDECPEDGPSEISWLVKCETEEAQESLSSAIKEHWKQQFMIDLPCKMLYSVRSSLMKDTS